MPDQILELIFDGELTRDQVERKIADAANADRRDLGNAFDCGGWNTLAVVFNHRHFTDVAGVRDARQRVAERLDVGMGIAVRIYNDMALPVTQVARSKPASEPKKIEPEPTRPAVEAGERDAFEMTLDPAYAARQREIAFLESEEGRMLKSQVDAVEARKRAFAPDIIQRMGTQASKTRGCGECGSSIAVTHIKSSEGEDGFTTIRCPVCDADEFCVQETDLKRRDTILSKAQKARRLYDDALARFEHGEPAQPVEVVEMEPEAVDEAEAPLPAEPAMAPIAENENDQVDLEAAPSREVPDQIWLVIGRVYVAAEAA